MRIDIFQKTTEETQEEKKNRRTKLIASMKSMTDDQMILNCLDRALRLTNGEFSKKQRDYRKSPDYIAKQKEYILQLKQATSSARNKHQTWTTRELDELMNSKETDHEIAKRLGRTLHGVKSKRKKVYKEMALKSTFPPCALVQTTEMIAANSM